MYFKKASDSYNFVFETYVGTCAPVGIHVFLIQIQAMFSFTFVLAFCKFL
jgi:hypothetical protein